MPDTSNYLSFPAKLFIASFTRSLLKWSNPDRESCNVLQLPSWRQWNSILRINGLKPDYSVHLLFLIFFNMIERQTINNLNIWLATWWNVSIEKRALSQKKKNKIKSPNLERCIFKRVLYSFHRYSLYDELRWLYTSRFLGLHLLCYCWFWAVRSSLTVIEGRNFNSTLTQYNSVKIQNTYQNVVLHRKRLDAKSSEVDKLLQFQYSYYANFSVCRN